MNTPIIITATYLLLQLYSLSHKHNTILWCVCCRHRSWFQWFKIFSRRPNFFVMMGKKRITTLIIFDTFEKTSENKNSNNNNKLHYCAGPIMEPALCPKRNEPDFRRTFFWLNYIKITKNIYIQSWMVTEIISGEIQKNWSSFTSIDYQIQIMTFRSL